MNTFPTSSFDPQLEAQPITQSRPPYRVFTGEIMVPVLKPRRRPGQQATLERQLEILRLTALRQGDNVAKRIPIFH